ncbi:hypothetical protein M231_06078 [Tremella mesenterica]|uniref:Mitochondrial import inner membrane translocase subunit TIM54 n=1 Tax=Tremella mesenterica TaxID=5217 RepID=A0A4Q1BGJ6_TREME|nr:hypothetical protein M231_06078 [Tremella mesenterica]
MSNTQSPVPPATPTGSTSSTTSTQPQVSSKPTTTEPLPPLTGFRAALEHTGLPRGLLTWKPRPPSRNWSIFFTVLGTISYLYYDDRKQCRELKKEYLQRVEKFGKEKCEGSLDIPRKVKVFGAKWPEDEDEDRALRYFRKYVKPYLVAAAIDYEQIPSPLYGSITRQAHADINRIRRQNLHLDPPPPLISVPSVLDPEAVRRKDLEGGIVLVGRPSLKEYMEGLRRGWNGDLSPWIWEKEVEKKLNSDGIFDQPSIPPEILDTDSNENYTNDEIFNIPNPDIPSVPKHIGSDARPDSKSSSGGLSFLRPNSSSLFRSNTQTDNIISNHLQKQLETLPPQPPLLLVPFMNRKGFLQIPWMVYDFFTERHHVRTGGEAAMKLIFSHTREFQGPSPAFSSSTSFTMTEGESKNGYSTEGENGHTNQGEHQKSDLDFDQNVEKFYKKSFDELPKRMQKARDDYYPGLKHRLQLTRGEVEPTKDEANSKIVSESELREERKKKELRWMGNEEGYEIVRKETPVAWDEKWRGWLKIYDDPEKES